MIRLHVLGPVELQDGDGRELTAIIAQPKRLALLVYLAANTRGFCRRDSLLVLFWPELDQTRARWALNQSVRFLRKQLGGNGHQVLVNRGADEIGVDSATLWCDATAVREHLDRGNHAEALELYRGDFLDGFFADAGPEFDEWLARERHHLRSSAAKAARALAESHEGAENFTTAVAAARRAVELADVDERVLRELLELLDRLGDRAGAIQAYDDFARRLANEYDARPASETTRLMEQIRARVDVPDPSALPARSSSRRESHVAASPTAKSRAPYSPSAGVPADVDGWQIVGELGRGGMATVYLARDVKHDRHVALKVMRPDMALSLGNERFLREIQITASLAHPHILPLIDSGTQGGMVYLVTPYVSGESLRERLRRAPALALHDALRIATEVAEALDYAHRSGIIHRDIKPENILLADGHAIVADFGVARAVLASGPRSDANVTSPGMAVGSPPYMSPEAVAGAPADVRTDIYSFGCVLFEMLAGVLPKTTEVGEALLSRTGLPADVVSLVRDCLAVNPAQRPRSAADVLRRLAAASLEPQAPSPTPIRPGRWTRTFASVRDSMRSASREHGPWVLGGALGGGAIAIVGVIALGMRTAGDGAPVRFVFEVDSGFSLAAVPGPLAMSPDGRQIAFVVRGIDGVQRLMIRSSGELRSRVIPGTERAEQLFFSPDGEWIGFYARPLLKKVQLHSSAPVVIGDVPAMYGGAWAPTGDIVVATAGRLAKIPANGGAVRALYAPDTAAGELQQLWPILLADGTTIVYTARGRYVEESRIAVAALSGRSRRILDLAGTGALGVINGQLVYGVGTGPGKRHDLFAVPFDERQGRVLGAPRAVVAGVPVNWWGRAAASLSRSGSLVYQFTDDIRRQIVIARGADRRTLSGGPRAYFNPRFSPDGTRLAVSVSGEGIYVFDLVSGTFNRVTTLSQARAGYPEWTPDGKRLVYLRCATEQSPCELWSTPADLSAPERFYLKSDRVEVAEAVMSRDGQTLVTRVNLPRSGRRDIWYRRQVGDTTLKPLVELPGDQFGPRISPDGQWLAFYTNTAPSHVFVTSIPGPGPAYKVSVDAGEVPVWSPDGKRLYYLNGTNGTRILAATLQFTPSFAVTRRDTVLDGGFDGRPDMHGVFDVAPDGQRFALLERLDAEPRIIVVHDWKYEMREPERPAKK